MSFTPKIVFDDEVLPPQPAFSDDAAEEMDLPPELLALGSQLARQAAALAECYPAKNPAEASPAEVCLPPESPAIRRTSAASGNNHQHDAARFLGPALGLLLALAAGVALAPRWLGEQPTPEAKMNAEERVSEKLVHADESLHVDESLRGSQLDVSAPAEPQALPAAIVHELSGPELEGFLDLLERDYAVSRLSI